MTDHVMPTASKPRTPRQLWQVPTFLLGLAALGAYLLARPYWNGPERRAGFRLDQARRLFDRREDHPRRAIELAGYYLEHAGADAPRRAEAHLIVGCTLARSARELKDSPDALPLWHQAYQRLIAARDIGTENPDLALDEQDLGLMRATLGECGYHTNDEPYWVRRRLKNNLDHADDRAEACRVLTLACLRAVPPDLAGALQANETLRQLPLVDETVLGPARLQGGEILLKLHRPAEARKLLEKIGKDAPAPLGTAARTLRARSHQDENQWNDAAVLWQELLDDSAVAVEKLGEVRYFLGLCRRRLGQSDDAAKIWRDGMRGEDAAGTACAIGLAELLLAADEAAAADVLVAVAGRLRRGEAWTNPYVNRKQVEAVFEQGCRVLREHKKFETALNAAEAFARIAGPARALRERGLVLRDWGRAARSVERMQQAGIAFEEAAASATADSIRAELLRMSALAAFEGGDAERTVSVLDRYIALETSAALKAEQMGEAWYLLARAHEQLKHPADAEAACKRCILHRSKFAYRARYRLAEAELAQGQTDRAVEMLEQNIKQLQFDPDDEALEKSLYALGRLHFKRRDHSAAKVTLEEAVSRFPSSPDRMRGRFDLAECYRRLAALENQSFLKGTNLTPEAREHYRKEWRTLLTRAVEQYDLLSALLTSDPKSAETLTQTEQVHVFFSVADCRFNLGDYDQALKSYDELAERYKGRLERLSALGGTARCFAAQRDFVKFKTRLEDIRTALREVDDETRREWEKWLSVAGKDK